MMQISSSYINSRHVAGNLLVQLRQTAEFRLCRSSETGILPIDLAA